MDVFLLEQSSLFEWILFLAVSTDKLYGRFIFTELLRCYISQHDVLEGFLSFLKLTFSGLLSFAFLFPPPLMAYSDLLHLILPVDDHPLPRLPLCLESTHTWQVCGLNGLPRLAVLHVKCAFHLQLFLL